MIIPGVLKFLGNSFRYFSTQAKIQEAQNLYGINSKESLNTHLEYAINLLAEKKIADSKSIFLNAINISKEINKLKNIETSSLIKEIGHSFRNIGDYENSLQFYIQAYKIDSELYQNADESLLKSVNCIVFLYIELKQFKNAEDFCKSISWEVIKSGCNEQKGIYFHNSG